MSAHKDRGGRRGGRPHNGGGADQPHPVLTPLTVPQAERLVRLAEAAVTERGFSMRYDGAGALLPIGGDTGPAGDAPTAGLANLARTVGELPRQQWRSAVAAHFDQMLALGERPTVPEDLENELYLRLVCAATIEPDWTGKVPEFVPGVVIAPATYTGRAVAMHFDLDSLGAPWEDITRMGLANLRRLEDKVELVRQPGANGAEIAMLTGGMFTASRALVLDTVLRESLHVEDPPFGCLVALPARDMLLVHVMRDETVVPAFGMLTELANCFFGDSPGPVSPHVYYVTGDEWQQVTDYSTGTAQLQASGRFSAALRRLDSELGLSHAI
ncbi:hypothetical protein [Kribbella speibonae]|uniref:Uncharacterized protein n=1 Tax=Kribbella speibonae TaxID=1572660 RepID=A0A4R0IQI3_9ACTN|nr:hypothetical protein [Kribbella speibonae]TCC24670.1 hypothetical protein E0H58_10630 [Kribbella speibonae]TCC30915.1 hypothetical protein E0H92_38090 [Kribbella speibonae]